MKSTKQMRGIKSLVQAGVEHGSLAIERVQKESVRLPFAVLELIPTVGPIAKLIHALHDASVSSTHTAIRLINQAVGAALDATFDIIDRKKTDSL